MKPPLRNLPSANVANGGLIRIIHRWSIRGGKDALARFGTLHNRYLRPEKSKALKIMVLKRDVIFFSKGSKIKVL